MHTHTTQLTLLQYQTAWNKHLSKCVLVYCDPCAVVSGSYLPVVAFLAELFLEVSQGEAVGLHHAAIRNLLTAEEVGDHELLRPENAK